MALPNTPLTSRTNKEQPQHSVDLEQLRAVPQELTLVQAEAALENYRTTPKTTLLISSDWQLLTDAEVQAGTYTIIGRCEIGIYENQTTQLEEYHVYRIEVDLSRYKPTAGGLREYFLTFMEKWLQLKPHPHLFRFTEKPLDEIMLQPFEPAKITLSLH